MKFEITDRIDEKDLNTIHTGLHDYNISKIEDKNPKELGVYHRVDGVLKAGLTGETHGNWLEIEFLWVSEELRHQGFGSRLLKAAEEEGIRRGCKYSFLNTFGFQAPEFYSKYGYKEVFCQEEYPRTGTRHYYIKTL